MCRQNSATAVDRPWGEWKWRGDIVAYQALNVRPAAWSQGGQEAERPMFPYCFLFRWHRLVYSAQCPCVRTRSCVRIATLPHIVTPYDRQQGCRLSQATRICYFGFGQRNCPAFPLLGRDSTASNESLSEADQIAARPPGTVLCQMPDYSRS